MLLIGVSLGVAVAWWSRRAQPAATTAEAQPIEAPPSRAATAGGAGTATPVTAAAAPARAGGAAVIQQLDVQEMLREQSTVSSGWKLARLRGNPAVMVLQFPNLTEQGAAMNRIAALIEKAGAPRDRVLNDLELQVLINSVGDNAQTFYQGHDYVAEQIARFFTLADKQGQPMNPHELKLRQLLEDKKVIAREGGIWAAQGLQAIVTFTATQADDPRTPQDEGVDERRRESVLMHELSHGLYFTSREYRDHCWQFWRSGLSEDERRAMRRLLARMNYDPNNEDLLVNEMQALLMNTPDVRAFSAQSLGIGQTQLESMRARFRKGWPRN